MNHDDHVHGPGTDDSDDLLSPLDVLTMIALFVCALVTLALVVWGLIEAAQWAVRAFGGMW